MFDKHLSYLLGASEESQCDSVTLVDLVSGIPSVHKTNYGKPDTKAFLCISLHHIPLDANNHMPCFDINAYNYQNFKKFI